jgi:2-polyprenyl-3-methyl-5-hydroxy-6-metoxy-1,4-benzoquinol methylase
MCSLCEANGFELFRVIPQLNRRIVRCRNCGLVFVGSADRLFVTFDFEHLEEREEKYRAMQAMAEEEGKHDEEMIEQEEDVRILHFSERRKTIERFVKTGRLLDIGCGRGFFLRNFVGSSFDYLGLEPRKRISEEAKKRVGEEKILCGTLKEVSLPDSSFDVVTMINLIEHLPSPRDNLEEVNRIMKRGGLLYVETPNVDSFVSRILGRRWHAFLEREHHYFFSKDSLAKMLTKTGFRVKQMRMGNKLFSVPYLLYRLAWYDQRMPARLEKILRAGNLLEKKLRIPQFDELIVIARKSQ